MRGLREAVRNMRLVNTDQIVKQGKRAFHLGIELAANPKRTDLERQCWNTGWHSARQRWSSVLARNGGYLGMPSSFARPSER